MNRFTAWTGENLSQELDIQIEDNKISLLQTDSQLLNSDLAIIKIYKHNGRGVLYEIADNKKSIWLTFAQPWLRNLKDLILQIRRERSMNKRFERAITENGGNITARRSISQFIVHIVSLLLVLLVILMFTN